MDTSFNKNTTTPDPQMPESTATDISQVFYSDANLPLKIIKLINNTNATVYPIIRAVNSAATSDANGNPIAKYDPYDGMNQEYRGYIGYVKDKINYLGLPAGETVEVALPLVFWDAGRIHIAVNGALLCPENSEDNVNNPFWYRAKNADHTETARFIAPLQKNGLVMWYHAIKAEGPSNDAPDQLIEMTFRDKYLGTLPTANKIDDAEKHALVNYDVSYVDTILLPVAMEAADVPDPNDPSITRAYGWIGASLSVKKMQAAIVTLTSDNQNDLGQYFGGKGYSKYYIPDAYTQFQPDADHLVKLPAGTSVIANSPLDNVLSNYNNNRYMLESGGNAPIKFGRGGTSSKNVIQLDPAAPADLFQYIGSGTWLVSSSGQDISPGTLVSSVNAENKQVLLDRETTGKTPGPNSYTFKRPITDYVAEALINLWYSWANFFIINSPEVPNVELTGTSKQGIAVLTIDDTSAFSKLEPGMLVTGSGIQDRSVVLAVINTSDSVKVLLNKKALSDENNEKYQFTYNKPEQIAGYESAKFLDLQFDNPNDTAIPFARNVYQAMSAMSTIPRIERRITTQLLINVLGCNVGQIPNLGPDPGKDAVAIHTGITNMIKSILRGVVDFTKIAPSGWYPDPSVPTGHQPFNVYNLDPFVWFIHNKLNLSGYGFSVDDDTADVGADGATRLDIAIGGLQGLANPKEYTSGYPFGK